MKIKNEEITKDNYEDLVNHIYSYIMEFDKNYLNKNEPGEFDKGMKYAYWTILDVLKDQFEADYIESNKDLEKICDDYRNNLDK